MDDLIRKFQDQIEKLDSDSLRDVVKDRQKALELAKRGIEQVEPKKLTHEHIESIANELQIVAKMILEERKIN